MNQDPVPEGGEPPASPQSPIRVTWNVIFYLIIVPVAVVFAIKWLFGT